MVWVKHVKLREVRHRGARRSYHSCRARCECGLCVSPHRAVSQGHEHWALTSLCLRQPASVSASVTVPPMPPRTLGTVCARSGQPRHPRTWSPRRDPRVAGSRVGAASLRYGCPPAAEWNTCATTVPPFVGFTTITVAFTDSSSDIVIFFYMVMYRKIYLGYFPAEYIWYIIYIIYICIYIRKIELRDDSQL